jgi:hypothetical protein
MTTAVTGELSARLGGFRQVQRLAYECAEAVAAQLKPGVTEREAARMQRAWLHERGVRDWFHLPFAWFGGRTAFVNFRVPLQFFPTNRRLEPGVRRRPRRRGGRRGRGAGRAGAGARRRRLLSRASPQELAVAAELHAADVPLSAISGHLRELRGQVEHIAGLFLEFTMEHVFARYLDGAHRPTDADAAEAASLVRRLRPLAQQTVNAELARAIRLFAVRHLRQRLGADETPAGEDRRRSVAIPAETMRAVEALVGPEHAAEFITLTVEREVRARALDRIAPSHSSSVDLGEVP